MYLMWRLLTFHSPWQPYVQRALPVRSVLMRVIQFSKQIQIFFFSYKPTALTDCLYSADYRVLFEVGTQLLHI